jgi:PIN domain nuclease of toxin-antitoxin system
MRLLLDTHIFVWAATGDDRLSKHAAALLVDPGNSRTLSVASTWEMSIKGSSGRWPEAASMLDDITTAATDLDTAILSIDVDATIAAGRLDWTHRDPFDRMLAAQARLGGYALLTVDAAFAGVDVDLALPT